MGAGRSWQLAPQQHPSAANLDQLAPIWASADDMDSIREDSREPIGQTQDAATDLVEDAAAALRAASPSGVPSADSDSRRIAALLNAITSIAAEVAPTDCSDS